VGSLETGLLSTPPERLGFKAQPNAEHGDVEYPEAKQEIEEGLQKLETLLNSTVDKNFDRFEIYVLRNILAVPSDLTNWIKLQHYQSISHQPSQDAPTPEMLDLQRRKLAASRLLSKQLQQEAARNEMILGQLRDLQNNQAAGNLAFLTQAAGSQALNVSADHQNLITNTTFTMSQLPALKALLAELRPKLASLKTISNNLDSAKAEIRQERREYIEQRTRAHIDRSGGSDADDASALPGQPLHADDIQAMEKVAQIFHPT
jgi:kinetochore protein Mis12/MTW1